ncbi:MAG: hypothetical protein Q8O92_11975 [Candidatus Latescibacter sp.]|nr:hypothetical protein [Candidatus Latescibacter sp.]
MKNRPAILLVLSCAVLLFMGAFPVISGAVKPHTAKFTWQVRGGAVNPEQWIYDGDIPLAMYEQRVIEQPAEDLMFFNGVPKPPVLRHIRLTPDSGPLVECIQLYWVLISGKLATDQVVNIDVKGSGTDKLTVTFNTRDRGGIADSRRILTLTYDETAGSYVYDFQAWLTFNSADFFRAGTRQFEFCDPWLTGCPGPAVSFPGMWERRYQRFVYESGAGIVSLPINHFTTSLKGGIKLKPDGMFVTAYEPDGNPAIQFVGDTAEKSGISICWWGYDIHLGRTITTAEMDKPILAHFRVMNCPNDKAQAMVKEGKLPAWTPGEWKLGNEYPVYERVSGFARGLALDGVAEGRVDPFPWINIGNGTSWDKTSGRRDSFSLKIDKKDSGLSRWQTYQGDGEGYFAEPFSLSKGFRVSCYVKTEGVSGAGSTMAVQYHVPNFTQEYPVITAKKLTGSNGWTKLDMEVGPAPELAGCLMIMLQQDGAGTTWFDDLEVTTIK